MRTLWRSAAPCMPLQRTGGCGDTVNCTRPWCLQAIWKVVNWKNVADRLAAAKAK